MAELRNVWEHGLGIGDSEGARGRKKHGRGSCERVTRGKSESERERERERERQRERERDRGRERERETQRGTHNQSRRDTAKPTTLNLNP